MSGGITYGISFPFRDSIKGDYLRLTELNSDQIKSDLVHLLLTKKGSRYYLPEFGTRLYEYLFEPFDSLTFDALQSDIRDTINRFMPNLIINNISITPVDVNEENRISGSESAVDSSLSKLYRVPGKGTSEYTAKIRIDYSISDSTFSQSDFIIINI